MNDSRLLSARMTRALSLWKTEGLTGVADQIKRRIPKLPKYTRLHLYVMTLSMQRMPSDGAFFDPLVYKKLGRADRRFGPLTIKRITAADSWEIDEITRLDPWGASRSVTTDKLEEGWICYVVTCDGKVIASWWSKVGGWFSDSVLKRTFTLASGEAYHWRAFCVPEYRSKAVAPRLATHVVSDLARYEGVHVHVGFVRPENDLLWRTMKKLGFAVAGRVGFVEAMRLRVNYLWGKDVLKETKGRFSLMVSPIGGAKAPRRP